MGKFTWIFILLFIQYGSKEERLLGFSEGLAMMSDWPWGVMQSQSWLVMGGEAGWRIFSLYKMVTSGVSEQLRVGSEITWSEQLRVRSKITKSEILRWLI